METLDTYQTIEAASEGLFKDKGSKFITYAYPIQNEEEVKPIISKLKKEHHSARHHCYAWRLGSQGKNYRANDDGEPSGTAGRPILGQLQSHNLTNILVVVVRYFGGTLLGVSGLINAYRKGTIDALDNAQIVEKIVMDHLEVNYDYLAMNAIMHLIKEEQLEQLKTTFDLRCQIIIAVRQRDTNRILEKLHKIEGIEINHLNENDENCG